MREMDDSYVSRNLMRKVLAIFDDDEGIRECIEGLESADVRPNIHAWWVWDPNGMDWGIGAWVCSACHFKNDMIPGHIFTGEGKPPITHEHINPMMYAGSRFCGNCGATMGGVKDVVEIDKS